MSGALIAVVSTFVVAVWWWGQSAPADAALGMTGPATVMVAQPDELRPARPRAMADLAHYLDAQRIPLLITSYGESRPWVVVLGPTERVTWLSAPIPAGSALLVSGSYTAHRWSNRHTLPGFVPPGTRVAGLTPGPPDPSGVDFVVGGATSLPAGGYVLGTRAPAEINQVSALLSAAGATLSAPVEIPSDGIWKNRWVVATLLMLASALACLALDWSLMAVRLMPRLQLARRHGASGWALVRGALAGAAPPLVAGSLVGATATRLIPLWEEAGRRHSTVSAWLVVVAAASVLVGILWSVVVMCAVRIAVRHAG